MENAMTNQIVSGIVIALASLSLNGCMVDGIEGEDAMLDIDQTELALGLECADTFATQTFNGGINYTSPQTYNQTSCYKGVAIDVTNYSSIYTQPGDIPGHTAVEWADALPNTQAACQSTVVTAYLFQWINGDWQYVDDKSSFGVWTSFFGSYYCSGPGVSFETEMQAGRTYRIAATARTQNSSSAPTRKLHIESREAVILR